MPDMWAHVTHTCGLHLMADLAAHSPHSGWVTLVCGPAPISTGLDAGASSAPSCSCSG